MNKDDELKIRQIREEVRHDYNLAMLNKINQQIDGVSDKEDMTGFAIVMTCLILFLVIFAWYIFA